MASLLTWTVRSYLLVKTLSTLGRASGRSSSDNLKAALASVDHTLESIMSLANSPGFSINPARQEARNRARSATPGPVRAAATTLLGTTGTDALRMGQWSFHQDEHGDVVGSADDGRTVNLTAHAQPTEPQPDGDEFGFPPPPPPPASPPNRMMANPDRTTGTDTP